MPLFASTAACDFVGIRQGPDPDDPSWYAIHTHGKYYNFIGVPWEPPQLMTGIQLFRPQWAYHIHHYDVFLYYDFGAEGTGNPVLCEGVKKATHTDGQLAANYYYTFFADGRPPVFTTGIHAHDDYYYDFGAGGTTTPTRLTGIHKNPTTEIYCDFGSTEEQLTVPRILKFIVPHNNGTDWYYGPDGTDSPVMCLNGAYKSGVYDPALQSPRLIGNFTTGNNYRAGEVITYSTYSTNQFFLCKKPFYNATLVPPEDSAHWQEIRPKFWWSETGQYEVGDMVSFRMSANSANTYLCKKDVQSQLPPPTDTTHWQIMDAIVLPEEYNFGLYATENVPDRGCYYTYSMYQNGELVETNCLADLYQLSPNNLIRYNWGNQNTVAGDAKVLITKIPIAAGKYVWNDTDKSWFGNASFMLNTSVSAQINTNAIGAIYSVNDFLQPSDDRNTQLIDVLGHYRKVSTIPDIGQYSDPTSINGGILEDGTLWGFHLNPEIGLYCDYGEAGSPHGPIILKHYHVMHNNKYYYFGLNGTQYPSLATGVRVFTGEDGLGTGYNYTNGALAWYDFGTVGTNSPTFVSGIRLIDAASYSVFGWRDLERDAYGVIIDPSTYLYYYNIPARDDSSANLTNLSPVTYIAQFNGGDYYFGETGTSNPVRCTYGAFKAGLSNNGYHYFALYKNNIRIAENCTANWYELQCSDLYRASTSPYVVKSFIMAGTGSLGTYVWNEEGSDFAKNMGFLLNSPYGYRAYVGSDGVIYDIRQCPNPNDNNNNNPPY